MVEASIAVCIRCKEVGKVTSKSSSTECNSFSLFAVSFLLRCSKSAANEFFRARAGANKIWSGFSVMKWPRVLLSLSNSFCCFISVCLLFTCDGIDMVIGPVVIAISSISGSFISCSSGTKLRIVTTLFTSFSFVRSSTKRSASLRFLANTATYQGELSTSDSNSLKVFTASPVRSCIFNKL